MYEVWIDNDYKVTIMNTKTRDKCKLNINESCNLDNLLIKINDVSVDYSDYSKNKANLLIKYKETLLNVKTIIKNQKSRYYIGDKINVETTITNIHIRDIFPKSDGGKCFVYNARMPKLVSALIICDKERKLKAFVK